MLLLVSFQALPAEEKESRAVVLADIIPVAAVAATVGLRWQLCINHTK
jgi:hypothetical protein